MKLMSLIIAAFKQKEKKVKVLIEKSTKVAVFLRWEIKTAAGKV